MSFEKIPDNSLGNIISPDKLSVDKNNNINEKDVAILEFDSQQTEDKKKADDSLQKIRSSIANFSSQVEEEIMPQELTSDVPLSVKKQSNRLMDKIKSNKWLKRMALITTLGAAVVLPSKLNAQTEKESFSENKIELSEADASSHNILEKEMTDKLKSFSNFINTMIIISDFHPDSKLLTAWEPGAGVVQYYNQNLLIDRNIAEDNNKDEQDLKEYDVTITKSKKGALMNFYFKQFENDIETVVGYNEQLGQDLSALRYSFEEQLGFKKITAREFESNYMGLGGVITTPGYREDMDNHYIWVDDSQDEKQVIDRVIKDFSNESWHPETILKN